MSAHIPQPRPRRLAVLVLLAVFIFGCGPDLPIEPLEDVPFPELAAAESEVREQLETARRDLEASLGSDQPAADLAVAFGSLGELYHGYDLAEAAMASYRNAHRLAPGDARWKHLLGILQRLEGELEGAAASFASVLDSEPDDLAATLHLAEVQLEAGDFPASEELARKALTLDSESAAAHQIL
ncbi:MAG: tetratricopeptide repeat protein, partial [Acidobacteriota bacterium]